MEFWRLTSFLLVVALTAALDDANETVIPCGIRQGNEFQAIFNFGDSNSDTGSCSAVFKHASHPNGITYFGKPSGRLCDGRLIIDFIAEKLSLPHLSSYLDAIGANFRHGANFAVSGSTIMPVDEKLYGKGAIPIPLNLQLLQFQQFKTRVEALYKQDEASIHENRLPKPEVFSNALYTMDIGQNDLTFLDAVSMDQAYQYLPDLIQHFALAIEQLYQLGARRFLIHNTGPRGCLPRSINPSNPENLDGIGCVEFYNEVAQEFNRLLKEKVYLLRTKLQDSSLAYVDIYSAKYSLIRDANRYGFVDRLGYCCKDSLGSDIPYWNRTVSDQTVVHTSCEDPSKYISWDGIHYTEAANLWIVNQIFDGSLHDPLVNMFPYPVNN